MGLDLEGFFFSSMWLYVWVIPVEVFVTWMAGG